MARYSDGKAIDVTALAAVVRGTPARIEGWNGVYVTDAATGALVALECDAEALHYFATPVGVGAARGDIIQITTAGALVGPADITAGNRAFAKVEKIRDAGGVVGARILNIS